MQKKMLLAMVLLNVTAIATEAQVTRVEAGERVEQGTLPVEGSKDKAGTARLQEAGGTPRGTTGSPLAAIPPKLRLGEAVKPKHYTVELTVVPAEDTFAGSVDIDLEFREATSLLWLNAAELTVQETSFQAGSRSIPVRPVPGDGDFLGFAFDRPVAPGPGKLHIRYSGKLQIKDTNGLFKQKEGNDWYVFSQFEAIDARRAFPCFDEPAFKVPWQLTLYVKDEHLALSNTPVISESKGANGMKTVKFAETRPLPSYLIALAVGPFEIVDAGKVGRKGTPVRIITRRGKSRQAGYAAQVTPDILRLLENYFGIPYPYEKLDSIAIPQTVFFGAMENPGLVTYNQSILLIKPEEETIRQKRGYAGTCAHELAHQWFGDLVTMAWWDDVWLNEAFASWMGRKIIDQWKPMWDIKVAGVSSRSFAMGNDSLVTARKIRQPIESKNDIANAFDNITYGKGAAILEMFESWIGVERFRKGVQRYLEKHAWGNATAEDFLAAVSAEAGRDIAPAFSTFLDQAGVPLLTVELKCNRGSPPKLLLSQRRYLPTGSQGSQEQLWQIPVCIKYGLGRNEDQECTLLTRRTEEFPLASANDCPDWVLPNKGETGYYRVLYRGDLLNRLLQDGAQRLTLPERVGIIGDLSALARAGELPLGEALSLVPSFLKDPNRHIISSTVGIVASINDHLVPEELRPNYARFIREMYSQKARDLGWRARAGEDEDTRLLRSTLLAFVADQGEDREVVVEAEKLARLWLEDRKAIDPEMVDAVLSVAAQQGDRTLFDRFHAEAKKTEDRRERRQLLGAMASFRDPDIVRAALSLVLTEEFDVRESINLVWGAEQHPKTRTLAYDFVKQNYDALVAKLPRDYGARLPTVGAAFCDAEHRADLEAFFRDRSAQVTGGPRLLAQAIEHISLCMAFKNAQQASVETFLKRY